jgi:DNA-binding transcriptional LysR family regulator
VDRLEAMSLLVSAVESGSLSAAGRKLGVPLPTVSRKISDLEAHLNTRLLTRSTRRLALTDAGAAYVAAVKRILGEVGEAERAASGEYAAPRGDLVITAPVVFGRLHVLPVINDFLTRYPEINARLVLSDRNLHLIDDHIDMAVRIGALADSSLAATRVGAVRLVVCGSPAYFGPKVEPRAACDRPLAPTPAAAASIAASAVLTDRRDAPGFRRAATESAPCLAAAGRRGGGISFGPSSARLDQMRSCGRGGRGF